LNDVLDLGDRAAVERDASAAVGDGEVVRTDEGVIDTVEWTGGGDAVGWDDAPER
jgi:hypothetical protein